MSASLASPLPCVRGSSSVLTQPLPPACLQICDLNLAKLMDDSTNSSSLAALNPRWLVRSSHRMRSHCCRRVPSLPLTTRPTPFPLQAPEVMSGEKAGPAADVYSFGVVLWELCTLELPWGRTGPYQVQGALHVDSPACSGASFPEPDSHSISAWMFLQIISLVLGGGRMEIPARERLPGPDTASFAGGAACCAHGRFKPPTASTGASCSSVYSPTVFRRTCRLHPVDAALLGPEPAGPARLLRYCARAQVRRLPICLM